MVVLLFFTTAVIMSLLIILLKKRVLTKILSLLFAVFLIGFTFYSWQNLNRTEFSYFTFDSAGVLLLSILALLSIPTIYHGFIYTVDDDPKKHSIYHAAHNAYDLYVGSLPGKRDDNSGYLLKQQRFLLQLLFITTVTMLLLKLHGNMCSFCSTGIALAYLGILFLDLSMVGMMPPIYPLIHLSD